MAVGRIGRPHGLRGEVTVLVQTDDPDARFAAGSVLLTDPSDRGPLTVSSTRRSGEVRLLGFEGVADRDAAEALRGTTLLVATVDLPAADRRPRSSTTTSWSGWRCVDRAGDGLGVVADVLHAAGRAGAGGDPTDGATELVPFVVGDRARRRPGRRPVVVDPPDGMFA